MSKHTHIHPPKVSAKEAAKIDAAARHAYGNEDTDKFMDRVLAHARDFDSRKRGEKVITE